jgi:hypothetical protein
MPHRRTGGRDIPLCRAATGEPGLFLVQTWWVLLRDECECARAVYVEVAEMEWYREAADVSFTWGEERLWDGARRVAASCSLNTSASFTSQTGKRVCDNTARLAGHAA